MLKKRGEIEEENAREEAREKGRGGHRRRRPQAQGGACDAARKWGGDGAAQPQRNAASGGLLKNLKAWRGSCSPSERRQVWRVAFHGTRRDYFFACRAVEILKTGIKTQGVAWSGFAVAMLVGVGLRRVPDV